MRLSINIDRETYERLQTEANKSERSIAAQVRLIIKQAYAPELNKVHLVVREREAFRLIINDPLSPPEATP